MNFPRMDVNPYQLPAGAKSRHVEERVRASSSLYEIVKVTFPSDPAAKRENGGRFMVGVQSNGVIPPYDLMTGILNQVMELIGVLFADSAFLNRNMQASLMHGIGIHIHHEQQDICLVGIHFSIKENMVVVGLVKPQIGERM